MTSTGSATFSAVIDHGDGTYSATMTNTVAEDVTVSATIDGNNVTNRLDITFTAGFASAVHSTLESVKDSIYVPYRSTTSVFLTLQAKDAHGNPLTTGGLLVTMTRFSASVLTNGSATLSAVTDNDNGTYSAITTYTNMNPPGNIAFSAYSVIRAKIDGQNVLDTARISFY